MILNIYKLMYFTYNVNVKEERIIRGKKLLERSHLLNESSNKLLQISLEGEAELLSSTGQ